MKKTLLIALCCLLGIGANAQNARIKIDKDRQIGEIDKNLYGNFVEHLGRCVYGGIYDPDSPQADAEGIRTDVLEALKDMNVSIVRYPGGNFVSNYHWLDGVGPNRIPRLEHAWQRLETNEFGTNEFVSFAKKLGIEPYFAVNLGTGTMEEAMFWVEYCNTKEGSYYAELRKQHGYPEPHNVKYWSLGNEMDGDWQMGHLDADDYVKKARETAKLMRNVDPSIKIVASGSSNYNQGADPNHWNSTILSGLKGQIDYIALHMYVGNQRDNYYDFVATSEVMDRRTKVVKGMIDREMQNSRRPIYIAWDEYNVWYRARSGASAVGNNALEEKYNLEDALVIGCFLNTFVRNADIVKMANLAQLVNVIAPVFTNKETYFKQTIYYPLQLFGQYMKGTSLDVLVDCDRYDTSRSYNIGDGAPVAQVKGVPYLDVTAAIDGDDITIAVVNRHKDDAIKTDIICQEGKFEGAFEVYEMNGPDIKAENDFGKTNVQTTKKASVKSSAEKIVYSFPAHSLTILRGKIK